LKTEISSGKEEEKKEKKKKKKEKKKRKRKRGYLIPVSKKTCFILPSFL